MNYYDANPERTEELFERFFPGRRDVWRFLMEPITYANGSTLQEPSISYGIVFGNFMSEGVFTFLGGTDLMLKMMTETLLGNGVEIENCCRAEKIVVEKGHVRSVVLNGREVGCKAVVCNGSLPRLVHELVGDGEFRKEFLDGFQKDVRLSTSSCQVYMGIKRGEKLPYLGELLFTSRYPEFDSDALCARNVTSRTYSIYYPEIRPGAAEYSVVASMNARYEDWASMSPEEYRAAKQAMVEDTLDAFAEYVPDIRRICDVTDAATPLTFARYTGHQNGATFGTKFSALPYSMNLSRELPGLFHTGSTAIIMSGWLGSVNYGVITANEVDKYLNRCFC
jgi:phytoene dehydrogenase-like protein